MKRKVTRDILIATTILIGLVVVVAILNWL